MTFKFGTIDYFTEQFSDILADVDVERDPNGPDIILKAFFNALDEWLGYHEKQAQAYYRLQYRLKEALND